MPRAAAVAAALRTARDPARAAAAARFFKTGPGEYGEGDQFLGIAVPTLRKLAARYRHLPLGEVLGLLRSPFHEQRLLALLCMVHLFRATPPEQRRVIVDAYLSHIQFVNNWDLVDSSAHLLVGAWLCDKGTNPGGEIQILHTLARRPDLWARRIAMLSTYAFIRAGSSVEALEIATLLVQDEEDLMHKAVGWMLREVGKRVSLSDLRAFLTTFAARMPRTMLRYAIEHLSAAERADWLAARELSGKAIDSVREPPATKRPRPQRSPKSLLPRGTTGNANRPRSGSS